jgi:hypothetical protein
MADVEPALAACYICRERDEGDGRPIVTLGCACNASVHVACACRWYAPRTTVRHTGGLTALTWHVEYINNCCICNTSLDTDICCFLGGATQAFLKKEVRDGEFTVMMEGVIECSELYFALAKRRTTRGSDEAAYVETEMKDILTRLYERGFNTLTTFSDGVRLLPTLIRSIRHPQSNMLFSNIICSDKVFGVHTVEVKFDTVIKLSAYVILMHLVIVSIMLMHM